MRRAILSIFTVLILIACGAWLYVLDQGASQQFMDTWTAFGVQPYKLTLLLFEYIEYWLFLMWVIALISIAPLFSSGRVQYLSVVLSSMFLIVLLGTVYVNMVVV
ncbi:hypothetical protein [Teredinibacter sp. KSP-S5-2]|uniref:hypothetical protein n=1 Tax=Teredinibacter sp. KSP-S5-2 TaxID=3034506 RepID=UPI0029352E2D|nr:hypothetical protein [Teredinibacter sp. KSP-S5-2]WNO08271.1 hypothetical protein P5V12_14970 [Teredinibacter sp. KSP-S5-2]